MPALQDAEGKERERPRGRIGPGPAVVKKQEAKKVVNPLFEKEAQNFGIGQNIQPKRDLCFVKWPRYVRLQRQGLFSIKRMKVPSAINQFTGLGPTHSYSAA